MSIKAKLQEDIKTAMRAKDQARLGALRLIHAGIKQREIDERIELDDIQVLALLDKMQKQRRESIKQYELAARQDLVDKEQFELEIIQGFLPQPLTEQEIDSAIVEALNETGIVDVKELGKLIAALKPVLQGRADMAQVTQKIKAKLTSQ